MLHAAGTHGFAEIFQQFFLITTEFNRRFNNDFAEHVTDCAAANVCAMGADTVARYYNVGTGKRTSLREMAEMLVELTGSSKPISYAERSQATLVRNRIGCPKKAMAEIDFTAEVPLEEGLRRLIEWRAADQGAVEQRRAKARS